MKFLIFGIFLIVRSEVIDDFTGMAARTGPNTRKNGIVPRMK